MFHMCLRRMHVLQLLGMGFYKHELGQLAVSHVCLFCFAVTCSINY